MAKRVALLIDSLESLLKIQKGVNILWEARVQGAISWSSAYICDIRKDPREFDYVIQEINQTGMDFVFVVSDKDDDAGIVLASLRHKHGNRTVNIVPVVLGRLGSNPIKVFRNFISGNLPEIESSEYKKAKRLAPYEVMTLFPEKIYWRKKIMEKIRNFFGVKLQVNN